MGFLKRPPVVDHPPTKVLVLNRVYLALTGPHASGEIRVKRQNLVYLGFRKYLDILYCRQGVDDLKAPHLSQVNGFKYLGSGKTYLRAVFPNLQRTGIGIN